MVEYKLSRAKNMVGDSCLVIRKRKLFFWYVLQHVWSGTKLWEEPSEKDWENARLKLIQARNEKW